MSYRTQMSWQGCHYKKKKEEKNKPQAIQPTSLIVLRLNNHMLSWDLYSVYASSQYKVVY